MSVLRMASLGIIAATITLMVRQPTIKSLFLLMTLVALICVPMREIVRGISSGNFMGSAFDIVAFFSGFAVFLGLALALPLFIKRVDVIGIVLLLVCAGRELFLRCADSVFDLPLWLIFFVYGFALPVNGFFVRLVDYEPLYSLARILYYLLYISIGPLFAITCRVRQPQGK